MQVPATELSPKNTGVALPSGFGPYLELTKGWTGRAG